MVIIAFAILGVFISNSIFICLYCSYISIDHGYTPYKGKKKCVHTCIVVFSIVYWHRFFRIAYSYLAGAYTLGGILTTSMPGSKILTLISICISSFPVLVASGYNAAFTSSTKEQVFFTDIEVFLITTYSLILVVFENKYKLPPKEDEHNGDDSINNSVNDLLSNFSKHSDLDARIMRQNALDRIMKNLDLKDKGEDMFGDKLKDAVDDPRMRYSLQEHKNPYDPENEDASELDKRKVETMPDMKIKDIEDMKQKDKLDKLFNGSRFSKMLSKDSRFDKPRPDKDPNKFDEEESKGLSLSEIRRNEEEDMQTDDQPSNEIDPQDKNDKFRRNKLENEGEGKDQDEFKGLDEDNDEDRDNQDSDRNPDRDHDENDINQAFVTMKSKKSNQDKDEGEKDQDDPEDKKFEKDSNGNDIEKLTPSEEEKLSQGKRKRLNKLQTNGLDRPDKDGFNEGEGEGDYENGKYQNKPVEKEAKLELSGKHIDM